MAELDDIVRVDITAETQQVAQAGFGVPMIASNHDLFADRVRTYTSLESVTDDGFLSTTPEYKAASKMFAQSPRPSRIKIGKRTRRSTMAYTLTPTPRDDATYVVKVDGVEYAFTSGTSATATDIVAGLTSALAGATSVVASGTATLILTAANVGGWFDVAPDLSLFSVKATHADPGIEDDLGEILLADSDWYALVLTTKSAAEIEAAASWTEANGRLFCAATSDTDVTGSGSGDIASTLKASAYERSWVVYHPAPGAFADAALFGRCLPTDPGSITWKFQQLAGVPVVALTPSQATNALGKNAMLYVSRAGVGVTMEGKAASGEFIDNRRFLDWVSARIQENVFGLLSRSKKVPYTDEGVLGIVAMVEEVIKQGVTVGGFAPTPEPTVTAAPVADQPINDRLAREYRGVSFSATLAGAVHSVNVRGTVTV